MPSNVLEENSRQMDQHKKRLVFRTLTGNSEVWAEVHALQSGGDGAPGRCDARYGAKYTIHNQYHKLVQFIFSHAVKAEKAEIETANK